MAYKSAIVTLWRPWLFAQVQCPGFFSKLFGLVRATALSLKLAQFSHEVTTVI